MLRIMLLCGLLLAIASCSFNYSPSSSGYWKRAAGEVSKW